MNRFQFALLIFYFVFSAWNKSAVAAEQTPITSAIYPDVPREHWAFEAVQRLSQAGLMQGYPDGLFRGDHPLTRYEFPIALAWLLNVNRPADFYTRFRWKSLDELEKDRLFPRAKSSDVPHGHYAYEAVQLVQRLGIVQGSADNKFLGDKPLTRYEYATALTRLMALKRYVPK
jgi:hypothetical protein